MWAARMPLISLTIADPVDINLTLLGSKREFSRKSLGFRQLSWIETGHHVIERKHLG